MRRVSIPLRLFSRFSLWLSLLSLGFLDPCCVDCIFASPLACLSFFLSKPGRVWFSCFVFGFCCCCCWRPGRIEPGRRNRGVRFSLTTLGFHVLCSHGCKTSRSSVSHFCVLPQLLLLRGLFALILLAATWCHPMPIRVEVRHAEGELPVRCH